MSGQCQSKRLCYIENESRSDLNVVVTVGIIVCHRQSVVPQVTSNLASRHSSFSRLYAAAWSFCLASSYVILGVLSQKQISRAGTSNYTPQILWDVITWPCPWYLLLIQHSLFVLRPSSLAPIYEDFGARSKYLRYGKVITPSLYPIYIKIISRGIPGLQLILLAVFEAADVQLACRMMIHF